jgi:hypothetical protein
MIGTGRSRWGYAFFVKRRRKGAAASAAAVKTAPLTAMARAAGDAPVPVAGAVTPWTPIALTTTVT